MFSNLVIILRDDATPYPNQNVQKTFDTFWIQYMAIYYLIVITSALYIYNALKSIRHFIELH